MKLALVTQDFPPELGGIQTYCWELAKRFASSVDSLVVLAPGDDSAREFDRKEPFRVERCGAMNDALPATMAPRLSAMVARGEVDVALHAQWQTLPAAAALRHAGQLRGLFAAAHGRELLLRPLEKSPLLQAGYDAVRRTLLRSADLVFPVSHYTAKLLERSGVAGERCRVVSNGTDPVHFRPMPTESLRLRLGLGQRPVVLFAGRLSPNKGVDTAIAGMSALAERCPDVAFVVVGGGTDEARLRDLARTHGVADRCHFMGRVPFDELPVYYSMADVFVTLSREEPPAVEGFGIVFLEAGACGTPVIGARSGGIPDAIVDDETGLLVPPNDPAAFAQAAASLLSDPERRARLGEAGRQRVLHSGQWDATHDKLLAHMNAFLRT